MYKKLLPQTDAERIMALQTVLFKASTQPNETLPFSIEIARFVQPFLGKLQNSTESLQNSGTQSVNPDTLRNLIDQLVLDIWEEVEYSYNDFDQSSKLTKAQEYGVRYIYSSSANSQVSIAA